MGGSYGEIGREILLRYFRNITRWKLPHINKDDIYPLYVGEFILHVLMPQAAELLIMQDRGWPKASSLPLKDALLMAAKEASSIRQESWDFGRFRYPLDTDNLERITLALEAQEDMISQWLQHTDRLFPSAIFPESKVEPAIQKKRWSSGAAKAPERPPGAFDGIGEFSGQPVHDTPSDIPEARDSFAAGEANQTKTGVARLVEVSLALHPDNLLRLEAPTAKIDSDGEGSVFKPSLKVNQSDRSPKRQMVRHSRRSTPTPTSITTSTIPSKGVSSHVHGSIDSFWSVRSPADWARMLPKERISLLRESPTSRLAIISWKNTSIVPNSINLLKMHPATAFTHGMPRPLSPVLFDSFARTMAAKKGGSLRTLHEGTELSPVVLESLRDRTAWWRTDFIDAVCLAVMGRLRLSNQVSPQLTVYVPFLLRWNDSNKTPLFRSLQDDSIPWPALKSDPTWRERTTLGVISVSYQQHFIALAIFGPQRLVVPIDSAYGSHDHPVLKEVSARPFWLCIPAEGITELAASSFRSP